MRSSPAAPNRFRLVALAFVFALSLYFACDGVCLARCPHARQPRAATPRRRCPIAVTSTNATLSPPVPLGRHCVYTMAGPNRLRAELLQRTVATEPVELPPEHPVVRVDMRLVAFMIDHTPRLNIQYKQLAGLRLCLVRIFGRVDYILAVAHGLKLPAKKLGFRWDGHWHFLSYHWCVSQPNRRFRRSRRMNVFYWILFCHISEIHPPLYGDVLSAYLDGLRRCVRSVQSYGVKWADDRPCYKPVNVTAAINIGGGRACNTGLRQVMFHFSTLLMFTESAYIKGMICANEWWTFIEYRDLQTGSIALTELAVQIPLSVSVTRLHGIPLRRACIAHDIRRMGSAKVKTSDLIQLALGHECGDNCQHLWAIFSPPDHVPSDKRMPFTTAYIGAYIMESCQHFLHSLDPNALYSYRNHINSDAIDIPKFSEKNLLPFHIPLAILADQLPVRTRSTVALMHGINESSGPVAIAALKAHICTPHCQSYITLLHCTGTVASVDTNFPPIPLRDQNIQSLVDSVCLKFSPEFVNEAGCAVCGKLTQLNDLIPKSELAEQVDQLLCRPEVVRFEYGQSPCKDCDDRGPILAPGCDGVCGSCAISLRLSRVPKFALANGLWLGEVPDVLKVLTFAEKLLVARLRRHKCIVRIGISGMHKLVGNMICYPNPYPKLYHILPPHRDELDELLAIVFTGATRPLDEDKKRIPFVIRRNRVMAALNWSGIRRRSNPV